MKKYIVTIKYQKFVIEDKDVALALLEAEIVDYDYTNKIYVPDNSEVDKSLMTVDSEKIRPLDKVEKENKELEEAKKSADWAKRENEGLKRKVEDLQCQLKVALSVEATPDAADSGIS